MYNSTNKDVVVDADNNVANKSKSLPKINHQTKHMSISSAKQTVRVRHRPIRHTSSEGSERVPTGIPTL